MTPGRAHDDDTAAPEPATFREFAAFREDVAKQFGTLKLMIAGGILTNGAIATLLGGGSATKGAETAAKAAAAAVRALAG